jgi:hypothetical protein
MQASPLPIDRVDIFARLELQKIGNTDEPQDNPRRRRDQAAALVVTQARAAEGHAPASRQ